MAHIKTLAKYFSVAMFSTYAWMRIRLTGTPTLLILTYHRVLPCEHPERDREQPGMIISPERLHRHIEVVKALGAVPIHLDEWLKRRRNAPNLLPTLSVAFTFDDGWRDNYLYAYPVLKEEQVPATIFLVTSLVDTMDTFWPERVLRILRTPGINLADPALSWLRPYLGTPALGDNVGPLSLQEADETIQRLKVLDDATILKHLLETDRLKNLQKMELNERAILSTAELTEMSEGAMIKFGAHTKNHFRLNQLNNDRLLYDQVVGCLDDLKRILTATVPIFCYPNGDISSAGEQLVTRHYIAACTTETGWNTVKQADHNLRRFNLHDGNSGTERAFLSTIGRGLLSTLS